MRDGRSIESSRERDVSELGPLLEIDFVLRGTRKQPVAETKFADKRNGKKFWHRKSQSEFKHSTSSRFWVLNLPLTCGPLGPYRILRICQAKGGV